MKKLLILLIALLILPFVSAVQYCYQETANATIDCGLNTGSYSATGGNIYFIYGKPDYVRPESVIQIRHGASGIINVSIPFDCWNYNTTHIKFKYFGVNDEPGKSYFYCQNSTGFNLISSANGTRGGYSSSLDSSSLAWDGNWGTECFSMGSDWYRCDSGGCHNWAMYEEGMYWYLFYTINITIYNLETNSIINTQDVTIKFIKDDNTFFQNVTGNGSYFSYLSDGSYTISFEAINYTKRYRTITINTEDLELEIYLSPFDGFEDSIFTTKSEDTSESIEEAEFTISQIINNEWTIINEVKTDITGRIEFSYDPEENYAFDIEKDGYFNKNFTLDPILFSSYNVWLDQINLISYDNDYSGIYFKYDPKKAYDNTTNTFIFTIVSPISELSSYAFSVTYNSTTNTTTGTNSQGEVLTADLNIYGADYGDKVKLVYNYQKIDGENKSFVQYIDIYNITGDGNTWDKNRGNHYGLGLFDRILILTIIVIIVAGLIGYFSNGGVGAVIALMLYGFFWSIEFVNSWTIVISVIMLIVITLWRSRT